MAGSQVKQTPPEIRCLEQIQAHVSGPSGNLTPIIEVDE
jgi:hypothetical protein